MLCFRQKAASSMPGMLFTWYISGLFLCSTAYTTVRGYLLKMTRAIPSRCTIILLNWCFVKKKRGGGGSISWCTVASVLFFFSAPFLFLIIWVGLGRRLGRYCLSLLFVLSDSGPLLILLCLVVSFIILAVITVWFAFYFNFQLFTKMCVCVCQHKPQFLKTQHCRQIQTDKLVSREVWVFIHFWGKGWAG